MGILDGKATVVTGAGRGLGRAYAMAMAREGAPVVVNDIDADEAEKTVADIKAEGGLALVNADNIVDSNSARRMVGQCVDEYGKIDVLVNNAGIYPRALFAEETEAQIDSILAVNVKGTLNAARSALDAMVPRKQGSIINVSSGAQSGLIGLCVYGASKAAVAGFTRCLALEMAEHNIRVNALSPLAVGRFVRDALAEGEPLPTGPGQYPPENVAPLCVFLASDEASYVTGQVVRLEGDTLSLLSHPKIVFPAIHETGWSVEEISRLFKETLGSHLQPVGIRAEQYVYYDGLEKGAKA